MQHFSFHRHAIQAAHNNCVNKLRSTWNQQHDRFRQWIFNLRTKDERTNFNFCIKPRWKMYRKASSKLWWHLLCEHCYLSVDKVWNIMQRRARHVPYCLVYIRCYITCMPTCTTQLSNLTHSTVTHGNIKNINLNLLDIPTIVWSKCFVKVTQVAHIPSYNFC